MTTDDVRFFVEKKSEALKYLIAQEADGNAKDDRWYRNFAVERLQFGAMPLDFPDPEKKKRVLREAKAKGVLEHFENYVRQVEESIFDGVFSANEIEKKLQLVVFSEKLNTMQGENIEVLHNNPFRDTIVDVFNKVGMQNLANKIATWQQSPENAVLLAEKRNYYLAIFDEMSGTITALKNYLKEMQGVIPGDERILSLLERYEKCEQKICNVHDVVRNFRHDDRRQFS